MIRSTRLEIDSIVATVAQEAGIIELSLEQLEGIQGGRGWRWFFSKIFSFISNWGEGYAAQVEPVIYDSYYSDPGGSNSP